MTSAPPSPPRAARLDHLDVLRGVAMLGILPVNLPVYALPLVAIPAAVAASPGARVLDAVVVVLFERKFVTLFAFLFGAGLALQRRRHEARAAAGPVSPGWAERMARRLGSLFVFGVLHGVLLWHGEIVATYALVGVAGALLAMWRSARGLAWTGAVLSLSSVVISGGLAGLAALAGALGGGLADGGAAGAAHASVGDPLAPWPEFLGACLRGAVGSDGAFETAVLGSGTYARACAFRGVTWLVHLLPVLFLYGLRLLGLFALGMAAVRSGLADAPRAHAALLRRVAAVGLGVGLPLAALAWVAQDRDTASRRLGADAIQEVASLFVAGGYASLVALWATRPTAPRAAGSAAAAPFAAVGRTAFSNYVLQSVAMAFVFTGVGLGLHGRLTYPQILVVAPCTWAASLAVSVAWTRWIGQGPVEWAWRRVAFLGVADPADR